MIAEIKSTNLLFHLSDVDILIWVLGAVSDLLAFVKVIVTAADCQVVLIGSKGRNCCGGSKQRLHDFRIGVVHDAAIGEAKVHHPQRRDVSDPVDHQICRTCRRRGLHETVGRLVERLLEVTNARLLLVSSIESNVSEFCPIHVTVVVATPQNGSYFSTLWVQLLKMIRRRCVAAVVEHHSAVLWVLVDASINNIVVDMNAVAPPLQLDLLRCVCTNVKETNVLLPAPNSDIARRGVNGDAVASDRVCFGILCSEVPLLDSTVRVGDKNTGLHASTAIQVHNWGVVLNLNRSIEGGPDLEAG